MKYIRIGPNTAKHDLDRFAKQAAEFIAEKEAVSVELKVKGRFHDDLVREKLKAFVLSIKGAKPQDIIKNKRQYIMRIY